MELSSSNIKKVFKFSYILGNEKISYILSKENFYNISGDGKPEKIPYISENGTFLYFRKRKP